MRWRMAFLALVVFGFVTATGAQQTPSDQPTARSPERSTLVQLRVDFEMLQLDLDADRASLLEAMKLVRNTEADSISCNYLCEIGGLDDTQRNTIKSTQAVKRKINEAYGPLIERKKKEYHERALRLNEKKLALEEAEKLYFKNL